MSKETSIQTAAFQVPALNTSFSESLGSEMEGLSVTFDRAKIPSGGGLAFEIPGDDPDSPDLVKELCGVIVDHFPLNTYWRDKYNGQNSTPDCYSMDGKTGRGDPGGDCRNCALNRFGSADDGSGKACKNAHALYLLRSGELLPIAVTLPPTSIRSFTDYLVKRILAKGLRSNDIVTKVTLKKAVNATGITYSQVQFTIAERLAPKDVDAMRKFSEDVKLVTRKDTRSEDFISPEEMDGPFTVDNSTGEVTNQ